MRKYIYAKIFKIFPRGGALARFGKTTVFLSWYEGGEEDLGKVIYFYPEDLQKGPKGLYVEEYFDKKPVITRKGLLQDIESCKKIINYVFQAGEEKSLLEKQVSLYIKINNPKLYKKVPFSKVWDEVDFGGLYKEIFLKKTLSFNVNDRVQEEIKRIIKKVEKYKEGVDYVNRHIASSLKESFSLEEAVEKTAHSLDEKIQEWEKELQEKREREMKRQQMVEDFSKATEEISSIDDVVFL